MAPDPVDPGTRPAGPEVASPPDGWWGWRLWLAAATGLGLLFAAQQVGLRIARDQPPDVLRSLGLQLAPWYAWALLMPGIVALCRRVPLRPPRLGRALGIHAAAGVAATLAHSLVLLLPAAWLTGEMAQGIPLWMSYQYILVNRGAAAFVHFWLLVAAVQAFLSQRALRDRELSAARLAARLSEAELRALRSQLQPHFLFNTLNAIAAHVRDEPALAEAMVTRLSDLLRLVLENSGEQEVGLARELEVARNYLAIHEVRFGGRLSVRFDVEPGLEDALVPAMLLQPLVENAVTHGIGARPGPGVVELSAHRRADRLLLCVRDRSARVPSSPPRPRSGGGVGLANSRARLEQLYGAAQRMELASRADGADVEVEIPLRRRALSTVAGA